MWARYVYKTFINHTISSHVDSIKRLPCVLKPKTLERLGELTGRIVAKQNADPHYPYHRYEQKEIDALVFELYGLNGEDIREGELWYCRRYPKPAEAQGLLAEAREKYADCLT